MTAYLKRYSKTVKPRYRTDYKGKPCIITKDKAQVDIIRRNYKGRYTLNKINRLTYKIILEEGL